jgi:four helix bundle protein
MADASLHLIAWPKATDLALEIYRATPRVPKDELYGLTSQMRRAAVSVASNIAEGKGRYFRKEFAQFLHRARGSRTPRIPAEWKTERKSWDES